MFVVARKGIDKIYVEMRPCRALTPAGRQGVHRCLGRGRCLHRPAGVRLDDGFAPPAGKSRIVGRAISPADAGGDRRAVCGISQAIAPKGCGSQKVSGGRERPPYKLTGNVCRAFYRQPAANLSGPMKIIGPYAKARATRKEPSNTRRQCTPPASRQAQTEGCGALPRPYPCGSAGGASLPSQGTMLASSRVFLRQDDFSLPVPDGRL